LLEKWNILVKELLLQVLAASRNDYALAGRITERVSQILPVPVPASTMRWRFSSRAARPIAPFATVRDETRMRVVRESTPRREE